MRACAVETRLDTAQKPVLCRNLQVKRHRPKPRRRLCASLRGRNARQTSQTKTATQTLCEPARSQCTTNVADQNRDADFVRACAVAMHDKRRRPKPRRRLCASLRGRNARQTSQTKTATQTLCEPARSQCTTNVADQNRDADFVRACAVAMHDMCRRPKLRRRLCASLRGRNARQTSQTKTATQTLCEPARSQCTTNVADQNRDADFVRACAVAMHDKRRRPKPRRRLCASLRGRNARQTSQTKTATQILCEPAQSKCTSTSHESHFIRNFTGKMPKTSWSTAP